MDLIHLKLTDLNLEKYNFIEINTKTKNNDNE